jgi:hypothetical protein
MSDIRQRILDNIEAEAKAYIEKGIPMKDRGPMWAQVAADALTDARTKYKPTGKIRKGLTPEQRLKRLQEKRAKRNGMNWDEWMKICKSRYSIDPVTFTVTSIANGPSNGRTWLCQSEYEADQRIYELTGYTEYDHHIREGHETVDFRYNPLENNGAE